MSSREQFFACVLVLGRNEYQFHFRAWDAAEAESTFREALREDGFAELGTLEIRDAKGNLLRHGQLLPSTQRRSRSVATRGRRSGPPVRGAGPSAA